MSCELCDEDAVIDGTYCVDHLFEALDGHPRRKRPSVLDSVTYRMNTGVGKVYVSMTTDDDGRIFEVFVNTGSSGGYTNAWCEALGKVLSDSLRSGTDPEVLADALMGIMTDARAEDNGDMIYSIPDAVGIAMQRQINDTPTEPVRGDAP